MGDPSIRVNWFHNGNLIPHSSRIQARHDFGFANLDIKHLIPEDSGDYVCQVVNSKGQVQTAGKLNCKYSNKTLYGHVIASNYLFLLDQNMRSILLNSPLRFHLKFWTPKKVMMFIWNADFHR